MNDKNLQLPDPQQAGKPDGNLKGAGDLWRRHTVRPDDLDGCENAGFVLYYPG